MARRLLLAGGGGSGDDRGDGDGDELEAGSTSSDHITGTIKWQTVLAL